MIAISVDEDVKTTKRGLNGEKKQKKSKIRLGKNQKNKEIKVGKNERMKVVYGRYFVQIVVLFCGCYLVIFTVVFNGFFVGRLYC